MLTKKTKLAAFGLCLVFLFISSSIFAQTNWDLSTVSQNAKEGGNLMLLIGKMAVTLVGLIGSAVTGFNVFAKGQNSWQYIGGFVICLVILAVGMTMFGNSNF